MEDRGLSTSHICHQYQSLAKIKTFVHVWRKWWFVPWTGWWRDEVRDMVWHYPDKTFFVKNCLWMLWRVVSDCPPRFMTGTNCNSHDVIYLKRRTFFRNSPQYCTGTKKTNIRWASFSSYTTPCCVNKVFEWFEKIVILRFSAWIPKSVYFTIDTHSGWEAWLNSDDYIIIEKSDLCTYSDNPNSHTD